MRTLAALVLCAAWAATAHAQQTPPASDNPPVVLFGARYAAPTRWTGEVGLLIPLAQPKSGDDLGDARSHKGLEVEASAGVGGGRLAAGPAWLVKPVNGPVLFAVDVLGGVTRTWSDPRAMSANSTYAGVEVGYTVLMVRVGAGVAHRVAGPSGPDGTIFTWSAGFHTGW